MTTQENYYLETIVNLRADLAKAQAERDAETALLKLPKEYCLVCGGQGGHHEGCQGVSGLIALSSLLAQERAKLEKSQGDNARLAAALWAVREDLLKERPTEAIARLADALNRSGTTLHDLLAPTVWLLEQFNDTDPLPIEVQNELARLRAVIGDKA